MRALKQCIAMALAGFAFLLAGCSSDLPAPPSDATLDAADAGPYVIGPLDNLEVFVWRSPELSSTIAVRPDGRISLPLVDDMEAAGKTASALARDIERALETYVQDPLVTVMIREFGGPLDRRIRVVGEARKPVAIPYRANMTVLDVMIEVGGLTEFAAGDRAVLIRRKDGEQTSYRLRLNSLLREGDVSANAPVLPGDVILIPETFI
jgi:polysaccharide export outer membrane protein